MCALAIRTGIPPLEWEKAGGRYIATAFDLLAEQDKAAADAEGGKHGRVVMSG